MKFYIVLVTTKDKQEALKLTDLVLKQGFAACVNIIPTIESHYWWEGKIINDTESLLIIKTGEPVVDQLIELIKENHSYSVPEIIALPIKKGNQDYLDWIEKELTI
ncbi:divalent-cation tolerance protein CutA [bacterium]